MSEQRNIYLQRINLVIDYITSHLAEDLSLESLAKVAGFSPFHFHRIFKSITDEPLNQFIARVRVEQAAKFLRANPSLTILDAALICGYTSASGFSRAFKRHFSINPQQWDRIGPLQNSKISQALEQSSQYTIQELPVDDIQKFEVNVHTLGPRRLAYIRVMDAYSNFDRLIDAHDRLITWYKNKGGCLSEIELYGMSEDDLDITPQDKFRFDWCVAIPDTWQVDAGIGVRLLPAMQLASIHTLGNLDLLDRAWRYLWRYWLPRSQYQPANLPAMEIYLKLPLETGWETYNMLCAIPIEIL